MIARNHQLRPLVIGLLLIGILTGTASPIRAQDGPPAKSIVWERFDVGINVDPSGAFDVDEQQAIQFKGGDFTFGYRSIPKQRIGRIDGWAVSDASGHEYVLAPGGTEPYTFRVDETPGEYTVRWYFPATQDPETYTLHYRVHGGLRYDADGDQLWWNAVYGDRDFPVLSSMVTVTVPAPAVIELASAKIGGADAADGRVSEQIVDAGNAATFQTTQELAPGDALEVRVQFTPGVVAYEAPSAQVNRAGFMALAAVLALGLLPDGSHFLDLLWYLFTLLFNL